MVTKTAGMSALQNPVTKIGSVSDFYNGKTVFITGGTGFMGKVLLEKLLRDCPGVSKILLLIRSKKGQSAQERLQQLLCSPLFDAIRKERPGDLFKVQPLEGDITQPELAICAGDMALLMRTVNIVFHCAATIKFDEKLKLSVTINMLGTQRVVELCRKMDDLEAMVHVSTAYCNCDRNDIEEVIYPPPMDPDQVTALVGMLDEDLVDSLTPRLIGKKPNTYTFTKALAECWLKDNKGDLPVVIVRPSIILSSISGPLQGWIDNLNGPSGILAGVGKGIFRTMVGDGSKIADIIPVDMVINLMLSAAWRIGTTKSKELQIYNCCSGQRKPITWKHFIDLCFKYLRKHPFTTVFWYPDGIVTKSATMNYFNQCFLHWLPAYIADSLTWLTGGKPTMLKIQDKLCRSTLCLKYFTTAGWNFHDDNVRKLYMTLSEADKAQFYFDVAKIEWESYLEDYILGMRRFIFKEDASTLPKARRQMSRLYWFSRLLQVISVMSMWYFLTLRYAPLRQLWTNALRLLINLGRMMPFL